ncbi:MAG: hypothetical protein Q7V05_05060 [Methanoregula sp.]|nr:hypothetical protein [Methanoregula sp.]
MTINHPLTPGLFPQKPHNLPNIRYGVHRVDLQKNNPQLLILAPARSEKPFSSRKIPYFYKKASCSRKPEMLHHRLFWHDTYN